MVKRWYPAALSMAIIGCGGSVDDTGAGSSGGQPATGGVDTGIPKVTGGFPASFYGAFPAFGGISAVVTQQGGTGTATGGFPSINAGAPATGGQSFGVGGLAVSYGVAWVGGGTGMISTGGQSSTGASCDAACTTTPHCGDGTVQADLGETCDDGVNDGAYGGCTPNCQRAGYCGDGILNGHEQCDMGPLNGTDSTSCGVGCLIEAVLP